MGPLHGIRIVEFGGLGPGPLCGMILADMGAQVTVIERPARNAMQARLGGESGNLLNRGKRSLALDLKHAAGVALARQLVDGADALLEGNRPGVMERLGLGPEECLARNPRLVYGRMTGWGQDGPLAPAAGHDLNYVALSGVMPRSQRRGVTPMVPGTLVGDAPAGLALAFGIVCAVLEARGSGRGQVVDAAIVDTTAYLGSLLHWFAAAGQLTADGPRLLQGDAPFYDVYACADGKYISLGGLEPQFFRLLLAKLELADVPPESQYDPATWPALKARLAGIFRQRTQDEWCRLLEGSDVCFAPVLDVDAAAVHPHLQARGTYARVGGVLQAAPAPRFSRTMAAAPAVPTPLGAHSDEILAGLGLDAAAVAALRAAGTVG